MECPVCFEVYNTPLLLPGCGHTICRSCAEALITEANFLRCPECRLVYQLRQGIKSLPKNVALERTIDEHATVTRQNFMCEQHPDDAATLYCKTCEKSICLKCYFTSNTLRKGQSMHAGHQVDTSEDAFTKEHRLLEEKRKVSGESKTREREYVYQLEQAESKLKGLMEEKIEQIEKNKTDIITQVRQATGKLKFTLKGTIVRDSEFLQIALESARERLEKLDKVTEEADDLLLQAARSNEQLEVNTIKAVRKKLEALKESDPAELPSPESFLKVKNFDCDVQACIDDPRKALSYQTEPPRVPEVVQDECVISDQVASIIVKYNETVRVRTMTLYYKEAMFKGLSEKQWQTVNMEHISQGRATLLLRNLTRGTRYRVYVVASNDYGDSAPSNELWFRTVDAEIEMRTT